MRSYPKTTSFHLKMDERKNRLIVIGILRSTPHIKGALSCACIKLQILSSIPLTTCNEVAITTLICATSSRHGLTEIKQNRS